MPQVDLPIVDFRSAVWLPYDHRSAANADTRSAPNISGRACFFSVWRLVRPSQDGERATCSSLPVRDAIFKGYIKIGPNRVGFRVLVSGGSEVPAYLAPIELQ